MKEALHKIVSFLEGKKSVILSISGLVISFLVTEGTIQASVGTLLQSILSVLATGAVAVGSTQSYQNSQLGKGK